ncbi:uncharacterized ferritin-like protein (DUF455 family) [Kibdelosporangium banguiense]|uniref:Uncharacterized ferritin-like protein (DUF455 family) n=2 Tax=Kibdelosporangium banguiense TaxID=1365924 RepID=A0ABS4TYE8_9PSEU|nr:uncharacterized ferritin-like protein (DUF455 family) [Kibdelosporangium banguiense]
MASKTMRHSTLSTTTEIYAHLLRHVAHDAVNAISTALEIADLTLRDHIATTPAISAGQPQST